MIYVFKDNSGYQSFPAPGPNSKPYIEVTGTTEQRIIAGDAYTVSGDTITFKSASELAAETLATVKLEKRKQINAWRKDAERAGFSYSFPGGQTGTIQLRDADDKANITGLVVAAQADPEGTFGFRDGEDVTHPLTAAQVVAMGSAVQAFISSNYQHAWTLKAQVEAASDIQTVEGITW